MHQHPAIKIGPSPFQVRSRPAPQDHAPRQGQNRGHYVSPHRTQDAPGSRQPGQERQADEGSAHDFGEQRVANLLHTAEALGVESEQAGGHDR